LALRAVPLLLLSWELSQLGFEAEGMPRLLAILIITHEQAILVAGALAKFA
jgi:hypothetical protein